MAVKYRMNFREPNGRKFSKTANGANAAAAESFAEAIAAITTGSMLSATETTEVATELLPGTNSNADYSDATFHFRKGTENVNVHFEQLSNSYAEFIDGVPTGNVNISSGAIGDYAGTWSIANGGGWSLVEAHYVR